VRDWLYVKDHCSAIKMVMDKGKRGETYNIGGNNEMENIRIVELICDYLDKSKRPKNHKSRRDLITFVKDRPGHDRRYAIDSSKIQRELGWQPMESFETGLEKIIEWYLDNRGWIDDVRSGEYQSWIDKQYGKN
jgi:dTDP-glucose 4,6-dehydratase